MLASTPSRSRGNSLAACDEKLPLPEVEERPSVFYGSECFVCKPARIGAQ